MPRVSKETYGGILALLPRLLDWLGTRHRKKCGPAVAGPSHLQRAGNHSSPHPFSQGNSICPASRVSKSRLRRPNNPLLQAPKMN